MFQFKQARRFLAIIAVHLSILPPASNAADSLGILGAHPSWNVLEKYQETITHDEFARLINNVYCTHGFAPDLIAIDEKSARILTNRNAQSSSPCASPKTKRRASRCHVSGVSLSPWRPQNQTNRSPVCASRSIRGTSAARGPKWRSAGFKSVTARRWRKAI